MSETWDEAQARGDRERDEARRRAEEHAAAAARADHERAVEVSRLIAPLRRLAAAIYPAAQVYSGGEVRRADWPGYVVGADCRVQYIDGVPTPVITLYPYENGVLRSMADLEACLLHELGHALLTYDYTELDADALGAALAVHYEADLNAPLDAVLAHGGRESIRSVFRRRGIT